MAAVLLAHEPHPAPSLPAMIDAALQAGAQPVVVVLARDADAPANVRVARVNRGATRISALRAGMALLTNTTARLALVWPAEGDAAVDANAVAALVGHAREHGAAVTALAAMDLDHSPVIVARDAWLELMTLGEQGIGAVVAKRGASYVHSSL
jgi:hypothetical protein